MRIQGSSKFKLSKSSLPGLKHQKADGNGRLIQMNQKCEQPPLMRRCRGENVPGRDSLCVMLRKDITVVITAFRLPLFEFTSELTTSESRPGNHDYGITSGWTSICAKIFYQKYFMVTFLHQGLVTKPSGIQKPACSSSMSLPRINEP